MSGYLADVTALARKDLLVELRSRDTVPAMLLFVVAALTVFHFALPDNSSRLGFLGHEPLVYRELTPLENLDLYGRLYRIPERRERAGALLERFGGGRIVHGHTPIASVLGVDPHEVTGPLVYGGGRVVNVDHCLFAGGPGFVVRLEEVVSQGHPVGHP